MPSLALSGSFNEQWQGSSGFVAISGCFIRRYMHASIRMLLLLLHPTLPLKGPIGLTNIDG